MEFCKTAHEAAHEASLDAILYNAQALHIVLSRVAEAIKSGTIRNAKAYTPTLEGAIAWLYRYGSERDLLDYAESPSGLEDKVVEMHEILATRDCFDMSFGNYVELLVRLGDPATQQEYLKVTNEALNAEGVVVDCIDCMSHYIEWAIDPTTTITAAVKHEIATKQLETIAAQQIKMKTSLFHIKKLCGELESRVGFHVPRPTPETVLESVMAQRAELELMPADATESIPKTLDVIRNLLEGNYTFSGTIKQYALQRLIDINQDSHEVKDDATFLMGNHDIPSAKEILNRLTRLKKLEGREFLEYIRAVYQYGRTTPKRAEWFKMIADDALPNYLRHISDTLTTVCDPDTLKLLDRYCSPRNDAEDEKFMKQLEDSDKIFKYHEQMGQDLARKEMLLRTLTGSGSGSSS